MEASRSLIELLSVRVLASATIRTGNPSSEIEKRRFAKLRAGKLPSLLSTKSKMYAIPSRPSLLISDAAVTI
jgi:hypothetical protein